MHPYPPTPILLTPILLAHTLLRHILLRHMLLRPIHLRARYAVSGTDIGYAATRSPPSNPSASRGIWR
eukprot:609987-Rhodomonas_salina.1